MTTPLLDEHRTIALVREVVAEIGGDHRDKAIKGRHVLATDTGPCCLAGHVLHRHGVPLGRLVAFGSSSIDYLARYGRLRFATLGAVAVLSTTQRVNDAFDGGFCYGASAPRNPWRIALREAEHTYREIVG